MQQKKHSLYGRMSISSFILLKQKNMSKFSEQTYNHWKRPASQSEEQRISNAISMIKDSIRNSMDLRNKNIEVFIQGSYANNTNVRAESDIDICVMLRDTFYGEFPDNMTLQDYGFAPGTNGFDVFRRDVYRALTNKFRVENIKSGNKSIKISSNSYRVDADVVPAFQYRNYRCINSMYPNRFVEGTKFYSSNGQEVINYPKVHVKNGRTKNNDTQRRYKRLARILKRVRFKMIEDGVNVPSGISSFLVECLVWNTPNTVLNGAYTWDEMTRQTISYLYDKTNYIEGCRNWVEVSKMFYLFHSSRKWDARMANNFLVQMWNYLGYK